MSVPRISRVVLLGLLLAWVAPDRVAQAHRGQAPPAEGDESAGEDEDDTSDTATAPISIRGMEETEDDPAEASRSELPRCEREEAAQRTKKKEAEKVKVAATTIAEDMERQEAREAYEKAVGRYADAARDYQGEVHGMLKSAVEEQKRFLRRSYGKRTEDLEAGERMKREEAVKRFQRFIQRYPNHPKYTPDAMFRLAELYFEYSEVEFADANDQYDKDRNLYDRGKIPSEPKMPERQFGNSIRLYKTLLARFGTTYRYADAVYYLLGYVLNEANREEEAVKAWGKLVKRFPKSKYAPETYLRIGEMQFDFGEFELAAKAYEATVGYTQSTYFDKGLYKLGWTYFQLYDYDRAIKTFRRLIAWYETKDGATGLASALREEAIEYLAGSLAEDDWDNDGLPDADSGVERALGYLDSSKAYDLDIMRVYAKTLYDLSDNKKWGEAIQVYKRLIKIEPLSPMAATYQQEVIKIYDTLREIDLASEARKELAHKFGPDTPWWNANQDQEKARRNITKAIEEAMKSRAVFHHQRAQEIKLQAKLEQKPELLDEAQAAYGKAAVAYREYLTAYPHEPDAYDLTFYLAETLWYSKRYSEAAPVYMKVATDGDHTTYREVAAWSVIKAREKIVALQGESGEVPAKVVPGSEWDPPEEEAAEEASIEGEAPKAPTIVPEPIPDSVKQWMQAADFYLEQGLERPDKPEATGELSYMMADILMRLNRFEEARARFKKVISCYPKAEVAGFAVANIINTYRAEDDFPNLEKWANLAEQLQLGDPEQQAAIRKEIKLFKLGAQFRHAEALIAAEKWLDAAREFKRLADENPTASFADKAYFNAATSFKKVRYYDSASQIFEKLVTEPQYADSEFAEESLFELAETNKLFFNFERATTAYMTLFTRYPAGDNRRYALFQAAKLQEAAGDYRVAAKTYEQYAKMFPDRKESAGTLYLVGELYEKLENKTEQRRIWKAFITRHGKDARYHPLTVEAMGKLADMLRDKGNVRQAKKMERDILKQFAARGQPPGGLAAKPAAKSRFLQVEETFNRYLKLKLTTSDPKKAGAIMKRKQVMLAELEDAFSTVLPYKSTDWTIAATLRLADIYKDFADTLYSAPEPEGLDEEEYDTYVTAIEDLGLKFENVAIQRYEIAVRQSRKLKVTSAWAQKALQAINKYKPAEYPLFKEEKRSMVSEPLYTIDTRSPEAR